MIIQTELIFSIYVFEFVYLGLNKVNERYRVYIPTNTHKKADKQPLQRASQPFNDQIEPRLLLWIKTAYLSKHLCV